MCDYLHGTNSCTMFLAVVEENEVTNIVKSCKNKKSTGYDNVVPFTHICNKSFSSGVFPSKMKVAKVIHVYKAGKKKFLNYRPVSLVTQFSKIFEKLFEVRLDKFI